MTLSDAIVQSTRPIRAVVGDERRLGTAFWFRRSPTSTPVLITCRHVVEGSEHITTGRGRPITSNSVTFIDGVDLAILRVDETPTAWIEAQWIVPVQTLGAIEPIVILGHPLGLVDSDSGRPIARTGITATDPKLPFRGRAEFLVDAPCYPGSSGSPVLRYAPGEPQPIALLGVLIGGPALVDDARTGILSDWPKADTFHLGTAVDARYLLS